MSQPHSRAHLLDKIVCPHCDGYFRAPKLKTGEYARCPDCRGMLQRHRTLSMQFVLASALSGVIFLSIALMWPVLTASFGGVRNDVNLLTAPDAFDGDWFTITAYVMVFVSVAAPLAQVVLLSWLLGFALGNRRAPGFSALLPVLKALRPWAMIEVFFLGALIVIVKVGGWVSVSLGPGFWSLAAFSGLLAAAHRFESASLWSRQDLR
jgi:paraquat-inducible protein A